MLNQFLFDTVASRAQFSDFKIQQIESTKKLDSSSSSRKLNRVKNSYIFVTRFNSTLLSVEPHGKE